MRVSNIYKVMWIAVFTIAIIVSSCQNLDDGLYPADDSGSGPEIVFDFDAKPFPEIPFPNDIGTVYDETSVTKRRVNVSVLAPTNLEGDLRDKILELSGFGVFQSITVKFDKALDLQNIVDRHHDSNLKADNDAIFLINVTEGSPKYGTAIPLDLGQGNFPLLLQPLHGDPFSEVRRMCVEEPYGDILDMSKQPLNTGFFDYCDIEWHQSISDPHMDGSNLLFETHDEDVNGNGKLDPGEDIDDDGVLDKPNMLDGKTDQWSDVISFYERESDTLIIRPLLPLEETETYAVVLTKRLVGEDGAPIKSPFHSINHLKQTNDLSPLVDVLANGFVFEGDSSQKKYTLSMDEVAFTWSYTTQSVTKELVAIRKGLWGAGPLSWLKDKYAPDMKQIDRLTLLEEDNKDTGFDERDQYILPVGNLQEILKIAGVMLLAELVGEAHAAESVDFLVQTMDSLSHIVSGRFTSPYFLADQDGIGTEAYADDHDESFKIDLGKGEAHVGEDEVTWWCIIPRETEQYKQPFPTTLYSHGYSANRFEAIGFASLMARYGIATCGIDSVGHGLVIPPNFSEDPMVIMLLEQLKVKPTIDSISTGRARDMNNDGVPDSGGDFWTADTFHTRDVVRQSVIDTIQFARILRSYDGEKKWKAGVFEDNDKYFNGAKKPEIAGDFDADGKPDVGGPNQDYYPWGQSLGGFISALLAAVDPAMVATAPVSGAAGLIDVGLRSIQDGVMQAVFLPFMGPILMAQPVDGSDQLSFTFLISDNTRWWGQNDGAHEQFMRDFARTKDGVKVEVGDEIHITNLNTKDDHPETEDSWHCTLKKDLTCRTGFSADALDALEKRHTIFKKKDEWYFRGVKEIIAPREGKVKFWEPTEEQLADMTDEQRRLHNLRSEMVWIDDATKVGDQLKIEIKSPDGTVKDTIETWGQNTETVEGAPFAPGFFQGFFFKPGDKLVAPAAGFGKQRQTPEFRRLMSISAMIVEPADPVAYSRLMFERPVDFSEIPEDKELYEFRKNRDKDWTPHVNALIIPTGGDMNVPIAVEINMARAANILELYKARPEWDGMFCNGKSYSENDLLIYSKTIEAVEHLKYFNNSCFNEPREINFDIDNLDRGLDEFNAPSPKDIPLRATVESRPFEPSESTQDRRPKFVKDGDDGDGHYTSPHGISAMRIPFITMEGSHGFVVPSPYKQYDIDQHMINMVGRYFHTRGKELWDHKCLADSTCSFFQKDMYVTPYK